MKLSDVLRDVDCLSTFLDRDIEKICYRSHEVTAGSVFVAIKGEKADGHDFIGEAVARGAVAVVCQMPCSVDHILVKNSRKALAQMASNFYKNPQKGLTMIAVTGTNGKTSVSYFVRHILEQQGYKVGLMGTNQVCIGEAVRESARTTPESLDVQKYLWEMKEAGCSHVVMEVSSHALSLFRVYGLTFFVGIFTNLTSDHMDFHKTMADYEKAKATLFLQCHKAVLNGDDAACRRIAHRDIHYFSAKKDENHVVAKNIQLLPCACQYAVVALGEIARVKLLVPGMFSVYNSLAAITAAKVLGIPLLESAAALSTQKGVKGRAEIVPFKADCTVMIDYAHTQDGIENILKTVRTFTKGRVYALFGCGGDRDVTKRPLMAKAAEEGADFVIVTSDNSRCETAVDIMRDIEKGFVKDCYKMIESRGEAIFYGLALLKTGDTLVLMGKGHETYEEIGGEKKHFDEREVIKEYLNLL